MIIPEVTSKPIDRHAIGIERKFSIKPSAKAFRILSSTIYPDPIAAPIRELATNAADSHRDAGVNEPFLVHIPNDLEPYFSIRDYGTGISDDDIDKVYCTYFESTRTGSNNFTGGFGLGSKTPFCYSDTFTVTSFYQGRKMIFTAFLEDGEPKIAKFADDPTDERNGLEVSFAVKKQDISAFVSTALRVYSRFVDKPKIVGCAGFTLNDFKYIIKGADGSWGIRDNSNSSVSSSRYSSGYETSHVVMGNIGYPIDINKIGNSDSVRSLLQCGVEVHFGVGELQPTVSREHLQYDQDSIAKINNRLEEICRELLKIFQKDLDAAANLFDARLLYAKMFGPDSSYGWQLKNIFRSVTPKYKNWTLTDTVPIHETIKQFFKTNKILSPVPYFYVRHTSSRGRTGKPSIKKTRSIDLVVHANMDFFINDLPKGHESRIRQYIRDNPTGTGVYLIEPEISSNPALLKEIFTIIGLDESVIKKTSALPKLIYPKRVGTYVPKSDIQKMIVFTGEGDANKCSHAWETKDVDTVTGEHYYVNVSGFTPDSVSLDILTKLYAAVNTITGVEINIVGVRTSFAKKAEKLSNWKNFIEYAKGVIQNYIDTKKLSKTLANSQAYATFVSSNQNAPELTIPVSEIVADSAAHEYLVKMKALNDDFKKINSMGWVNSLGSMSSIGITFTNKDTADHDLCAIRSDIILKYPLLEYIVPFNESWRMKNVGGWKPAMISYLNTVKKV